MNRRRARYPPGLPAKLFGVTLLLYTAGLVYQAKHLGLTIDEPSHFVAGYMYWLGNDVLYPADTPPLTRFLSGWVPRLLKAPDPRTSRHWATQDAYLIGGDLLTRMNTRARRLLFYSRLPFLVFPILLAALMWVWGEQLYGPRIALVLVWCLCLEPTLLGHGAIVKSDLAAAFGAFWFCHRLWRYWEVPDRGNLLVLTAATSVAVLAKFTLLPLWPLGIGLVLFRRGVKWQGVLMRGGLMLAVPYLAILLFSQLDVQVMPMSELERLRAAHLPGWAQETARVLRWIPLPRQFAKGLIQVAIDTRADIAGPYLLGQRLQHASPWYFPLAWAVKFPIPLQALVLCGGAVFCRQLFVRRASSSLVIVWGVALLFSVAAFGAHLQIGFRHLAPVLPLMLLGGGAALAMVDRTKAFGVVAGVLVGLLAISSLRVYPHGISYFNEWVGQKNGWHYLADSNVDWGQNWPELASFLMQNRVSEVKAFLFSADNPRFYMPESVRILPQIWPDNAQLLKGTVLRPSPGVYAVSVNVLTGALLPPGENAYFEWFRQRPPSARAGYSTFIYNVP